MDKAKDVKSYTGLISFLEKKGCQQVGLHIHRMKNTEGYMHEVRFEIHGQRFIRSKILLDTDINADIRNARRIFFAALAEECEADVNTKKGIVS